MTASCACRLAVVLCTAMTSVALAADPPLPDPAIRPVTPEADPDRPPVRGVVLQSGDRRPVPYVTVMVGDRSARTDDQGRFAIEDLGPGAHRVRVADPGWRTREEILELGPGEVADLEIWVIAESWQREAVGTYHVPGQTGVRITLSRDEVASLPGTLGDPVRALQNAPGVVRTPLDAGWLLVRGGQPDDTGLFLDGVRVPLLYHLGGLTSIVHPEMVDEISFYPGTPPTRLGRSLSGAAEIASRPPADDFRVVAGLNAAYAHAYTEAPLGRGVGVAASLRRSWLDGVLGLFLEPEAARIAPRFWDAQARVDHERGGLLLVGLSDEADAPVSDGTVAVVTQRALQAQGRLSLDPGPVTVEVRPWLAVHDQQIVSPLRDERLVDLFPGLRVKVQGDEAQTVRWATGVEAEYHAYRIERDGDRRTTPFGWVDPWAEAAVGGRFRVRAGVRLETLFVADQLPRFGISPRGDLRWQITRDLAVVAEGGRYHQVPHIPWLVAVADGPYLDLERSTGAALGLRFGHGGWQADVDAWARWMDHLAIPEADGSMGAQQGRAYGVETTLAGRIGRLQGQIIYGFTRSLLMEEAGDEPRPSPYDQPHRVSVLLLQRFPLGFSAAARWRFASGFVIPPGNTAYDILRQVEVPIHRDAAGRAAPYHALDLKVSKRFTWHRWSLDAWIDVQNVYNRRVPEPAINGIDETLVAYGVGLPILPLLGVEAQIWP